MGLAMFWATFFGWMPPMLTVLFYGFVYLVLLVLVFKIAAFVWDVLPIA